jgi:tetratricopeptide (TPR) repeat protein
VIGAVQASEAAALAERAAGEEKLGHWQAAGVLFARAFRGHLAAGELEAALDALRGQARIRRVERRWSEAEELAELALEIAVAAALPRAAARAVNLMALLRYSQQDLGAARGLYEDALERALEVGDDELTGLACMNLGVISNLQGSYRDARVRYLESIGSSVRSGNKWNEMLAYNNLGMVCSDQGEWMEADVYFARGIEIAERTGDQAQTARLYANHAEPLIHVGEPARARETLDRAEAVALRIAEPEVLADVARMRGLLARREGRHDEAAAHLQRSLSIAADAGLELERAEALFEIGALRTETGQGAEARRVLVEAREVFLELGAQRDAQRADDLLAGIAEGG